MGRTSESLQYILLKRIMPQIKNNRTATSYKKHIKNFSRWARENGYRKPEQITRDVIQEYEQYLEDDAKGYSPSTIHAYIAPVCVAAEVPMDRIRKPKRTAGNISRGRRRDTDGQEISKNKQGDKEAANPRYARLVALQRATGIRRAELAKLTGADLVQHGRNWYVVVQRGKGGKRQAQYILPKDVPVIRQIFSEVSDNQKVFSKEEMHNKINLHGLRAQHGKECYEHYVKLINSRPATAEQLRRALLQRWEAGHKQLHENNPAAWERQRERFLADCDDRPYRLRGENLSKAQALGLPEEYNRLSLMCVSVFHLSHWRLDVTVTNYIIG